MQTNRNIEWWGNACERAFDFLYASSKEDIALNLFDQVKVFLLEMGGWSGKYINWFRASAITRKSNQSQLA